jgi:hypothetical protein
MTFKRITSERLHGEILHPYGSPACAGLDIGWDLSFLGLASLALG